jgi:hypothetical protein
MTRMRTLMLLKVSILDTDFIDVRIKRSCSHERSKIVGKSKGLCHVDAVFYFPVQVYISRDQLLYGWQRTNKKFVRRTYSLKV